MKILWTRVPSRLPSRVPRRVPRRVPVKQGTPRGTLEGILRGRQNLASRRRAWPRPPVFDLQGLLVEHLGSNIRNRTAHGLIDPAQFDAPTMRYLWWLALRLLLDHNAAEPEAAQDAPKSG